MSGVVGKAALVTGAGRGLGEGMAHALAKAGAAVMLVARDGASVEHVAGAIRAAGGRARAMACDVSDHAAVVDTAKAARQAFGRLDILVNNAGVIDPIGTIAETDPAAWARNIQINLVGAYNGIHAVIGGMAEQGGGTIVNISSGAAHRPLEGWSAYCSGKAGLAMLTRAVALEYGAKGIRAFGFSPGTIDTDMQVRIRASGINPISQIPREKLSPVSEAVQGFMYLTTAAADDLAGQDASMRDEDFRRRIGLG